MNANNKNEYKYNQSAKKIFLKGLLGVVTEWIQTDCEMPIEEMIAIIRKCIIKP